MIERERERDTNLLIEERERELTLLNEIERELYVAEKIRKRERDRDLFQTERIRKVSECFTLW